MYPRHQHYLSAGCAGPLDPCINLRLTSHNRMTKDQNNKQSTPHQSCSRIRASAPRRSNEYYNALINTILYNPRLGSKESHDSRYQARLSIVHSETESHSIRSHAARDLRLHGQSFTN